MVGTSVGGGSSLAWGVAAADPAGGYLAVALGLVGHLQFSAWLVRECPQVLLMLQGPPECRW